MKEDGIDGNNTTKGLALKRDLVCRGGCNSQLSELRLFVFVVVDNATLSLVVENGCCCCCCCCCRGSVVGIQSELASFAVFLLFVDGGVVDGLLRSFYSLSHSPRSPPRIDSVTAADVGAVSALQQALGHATYFKYWMSKMLLLLGL